MKEAQGVGVTLALAAMHWIIAMFWWTEGKTVLAIIALVLGIALAGASIAIILERDEGSDDQQGVVTIVLLGMASLALLGLGLAVTKHSHRERPREEGSADVEMRPVPLDGFIPPPWWATEAPEPPARKRRPDIESSGMEASVRTASQPIPAEFPSPYADNNHGNCALNVVIGMLWTMPNMRSKPCDADDGPGCMLVKRAFDGWSATPQIKFTWWTDDTPSIPEMTPEVRQRLKLSEGDGKADLFDVLLALVNNGSIDSAPASSTETWPQWGLRNVVWLANVVAESNVGDAVEETADSESSTAAHFDIIHATEFEADQLVVQHALLPNMHAWIGVREHTKDMPFTWKGDKCTIQVSSDPEGGEQKIFDTVVFAVAMHVKSGTTTSTTDANHYILAVPQGSGTWNAYSDTSFSSTHTFTQQITDNIVGKAAILLLVFVPEARSQVAV